MRPTTLLIYSAFCILPLTAAANAQEKPATEQQPDQQQAGQQQAGQQQAGQQDAKEAQPNQRQRNERQANQRQGNRRAANQPQANDDHAADHDIPREAVAKLIPTVGNQVNGMIVLEQQGDDVHVSGDVWNLTPGEHGFHIHQYGDLRAGDGTSAGGHYNPEGHQHAGPDAEQRHAGDLGNISAGRDGRARVDITAKGLKLHFVIGRSIVVHGGRDDLSSQPSGNAGPRVALGVIGYAEVKESAQPSSGNPNQPRGANRQNRANANPGQPGQPQPPQPPQNRAGNENQ